MRIVEQALKGDRRAIARLISLMESGGPEARQALSRLYPHTGQADVIGVTGAPGTGKSTLVNELAKAYRHQGLTVGIVAVDPTSPFSGGALLGDRIRMSEVATDPGIFIRSMASRGNLGGLARATADAVHVLDAAGYPMILVETVGAGQSEVKIAGMAHTTIVVQMPASGDGVQAIKAGILEIADIIVVNKADLPGAEDAAQALEAMLDLGSVRAERLRDELLGVGGSGADANDLPGPWRPPVLRTSAICGEGIGDLVTAIEEHGQYQRDSGLKAGRDRKRAMAELRHILQSTLLEHLLRQIPEKGLEDTVERIVVREMDPHSAAQKLIAESGLTRDSLCSCC
ncbi:MAG TPA: methylmalonyl Co-A mutase-associated GTPase MeaB [Anaerolineae bacterium]|nr:methylmalonyl Co-A mutase-associated GTPase MeaB [Anaerolineae bacterium]